MTMNNDFLPFALDPSRNAGDWNNSTAESLAASQVVIRQDGYSLYTDYYAVASEGSDLQTNGDETEAQNYVTVPQHYPPQKDSQFLDSSTSKRSNCDRGVVEENAAMKLFTNSSNSRDVLAMLISGNVRGEHYVPSSSLLQDCQIASQEAELASHEIRQNNIPSALKNLYSSSLHYRKAAQSIAQKDIGLATSFLLLSQSHWKRAEAIRLASRLPRNRQHSCNIDIPNDSSNEAPPLQTATPSLPDKATQSSLRAVVIRDALHANNATLEEDISASVFLGKNKSSTTDVIPKSAKEETSTIVPTNPVDDMLQLEKELHTMNMAISMHASVANLAATKTVSSPMNLSTSLVMRSESNGGLESSWWGQSSYLHSPRAHIRTNNVVDLTSSVSSWATTTTACSAIRPSLQQQGVPTKNSHATSTDLSHQLPPPISTSTSNPQTTNNNNNAKQLLRLLDSLKVLGDENATLLQQVEDAKKARLEAQAAREEMKRFQLDYQKRFHSLKVALEKLHQQQQQQQKQSTESNPVLSSEILKREDRKKNSKQQQRLLESQVQSLKIQVETLQEESKKKDAVLKKYENFYKEVKARSAQRAAQRGTATADSSSSTK